MLTPSEKLLVEELGDPGETKRSELSPGKRTLAWDLGSAELVADLRRPSRELVVVEDGLGAVRDLPPGEALHACFPPDRPFALITLRGDRDRERGRARIAWSANHLDRDGVLLVVGEKGGGIEGYRRHLEGRFGRVGAVSRYHCRLWRCAEPRGGEPPDTEPRPAYEVPDLGVVHSLPGVFAWRALDGGTEALLESLPERWEGKKVLDLGCGNGVLALHGAVKGAGRVTALDSSALALACARATLAGFRNEAKRVIPLQNAEVIAAEAGDELNGLYDAVLCNPPFHHRSGHALSQIGKFVGAAAGALREGGNLWMVLRRELPAEKLLGDRFRDRTLSLRGGYLVCRVVK
ncbi:MAG TPA: methyltransferase [bacterium]|nr:methyltransferase [bacterium]